MLIKINDKALKIATKVKDSFVIADTNWSLAEYYYKKNLYIKSYDHFNKAFIYFNGINKKLEAARMLKEMSRIKGLYRDYTGSEVLLFEAIKRFKEIKNYKWLYYSYQSLGLIQNDINEFDKAIFF